MSDRGRAPVYDRPLVAALYDLDVRLTSRHLWGTSVADQVRFAREAIAAADGGAVLDLPVGTGLVLDAALPRRAGLVVAVDLSRAMLRRARRRLGDRAVYVEADVAHLPFRPETFASCHSGNGFHLFADRAAAAAELSRTLQRGGHAAITTWTDQGSRVARAYQRALTNRGHIGTPVALGEHVRTFETAGLCQRSSTLGAPCSAGPGPAPEAWTRFEGPGWPHSAGRYIPSEVSDASRFVLALGEAPSGEDTASSRSR